MWLLGFELRTFGRAVSALNHWAILPALLLFFLFGWFLPWVWFIPAFISCWVYFLLFVLELSVVLSSCKLSSVSSWRHLKLWLFLLKLHSVSNKFWCDMSSFSLTSKKPLISYFFLDQVITEKSVVQLPCGCVLSVFLLLLLLLLFKTSLSTWWSDRVYGIISIFLCLLRPVLWSFIWSVLEKVPWGTEKKVCSFALGWNVLYISVNKRKMKFQDL